ncbi:hypothetical protein JAAARDRAFT_120785 [Jaapia argillacea MUCL 33604]|uniref:CASTOR ACT domain-containing protein n=1 Tax=Jaapia argillacea MUCL 33604 TaxID=933084 RepID=A0A067QIA2_9AGAM|nr:hypothetical protein JAAARDRAFT_120785 [Jaapia argillacea MUCL 33604]
MSPPSNHPCLGLQLLPNPFFVIQIKVGDQIPEGLLQRLGGQGAGFINITRTDEEISIVGESIPDQEVKYEAKWRCIKITGPMDFGLTGVLSGFTSPLGKKGIPIFAVSTWNTDYVLVPGEEAGRAVDVLREDGWLFTNLD